MTSNGGNGNKAVLTDICNQVNNYAKVNLVGPPPQHSQKPNSSMVRVRSNVKKQQANCAGWNVASSRTSTSYFPGNGNGGGADENLDKSQNTTRDRENKSKSTKFAWIISNTLMIF